MSSRTAGGPAAQELNPEWSFDADFRAFMREFHKAFLLHAEPVGGQLLQLPPQAIVEGGMTHAPAEKYEVRALGGLPLSATPPVAQTGTVGISDAMVERAKRAFREAEAFGDNEDVKLRAALEAALEGEAPDIAAPGGPR